MCLHRTFGHLLVRKFCQVILSIDQSIFASQWLYFWITCFTGISNCVTSHFAPGINQKYLLKHDNFEQRPCQDIKSTLETQILEKYLLIHNYIRQCCIGFIRLSLNLRLCLLKLDYDDNVCGDETQNLKCQHHILYVWNRNTQKIIWNTKTY